MLAVVALLAAGFALPGQVRPAQAYAGAPWFHPGTPYTGNFPDPSVLRVGDTYYAYSSNTGGPLLPILTSTDLQTWTTRTAYDPGAPLNADPFFNDGLTVLPAWAAFRTPGVRSSTEMWAPTVAAVGGRYLLYYALLADAGTGRHCISVATASSPLGPFEDHSTQPLQCDADPAGSIDPWLFTAPETGKPYLVWKSEGQRGRTPTRIWSRPLTADGESFAAGSRPAALLTTDQAWEGPIVENPSMVQYPAGPGGRLYLFYSGNDWASDRYAVGYAVCDTVAGPCHKPRTTPIMASSGAQLGPGGGSAFVDASGTLRLAYHWWNAPYSSYPQLTTCRPAGTCTSQGQRRLGIGTVSGIPAASAATGPGRTVPAGAAAGTGLAVTFSSSSSGQRRTCRLVLTGGARCPGS